MGIAPPIPVERRTELEMRSSLTSVKIPFTAKSVRENVHIHMIDPKGRTVIYYPIRLASVTTAGKPSSGESELRETIMLDNFLGRMLETKLIELLRFKMGKVYGAQVAVEFSNASPKLDQVREGSLAISFECDPAEADELIECTLAELQKLR